MVTRFLSFIFAVGLLLIPSTSRAQTYRYQDESGNFFFVDKLSDIPTKYLSQVVPPTPPPYHTEKEKKKWERAQARAQAIQKRAEAAAERKKIGIGKAKKLQPGKPGSEKESENELKQVVLVEAFVSPSCDDCPKLEKFLKRNEIKYKRYDIVKNQKAFQMFDQLGAGSKLPVVRIGKKIIKGFQPEAILEAATRFKKKDESEVGTL